MTGGSWTAMAGVLTFPSGCVSSCVTLNAQEAQVKEFINQLSSLNFFWKDFDFCCFKFLCWGSGKSLPNSKIYLSVPADSVKKISISEFLSPKFLAYSAEIRCAVKAVSSHFSYRFNVSIKSLFLALFSDNVIVKEHIMAKDKVSYYINYEIASAFRDDMLLTCMDR